jgi:hypothetical protein
MIIVVTCHRGYRYVHVSYYHRQKRRERACVAEFDLHKDLYYLEIAEPA